MLKETILKMLRSREVNPGETVEFSWFWFRVCEDSGQFEVETLDFQEMASFTRDFDFVERIHAQQMKTLEESDVEPLRCTLKHYGYVDTYYQPGDPDTFMSRVSEAQDDYSGWVVGVRSEGLPLNDLRGHDRVSLYEISIHDKRLLPYWLLPCGWSVVFENNQAVVVPPGESDQYFVTDHSPARPWLVSVCRSGIQVLRELLFRK